MSHPEQNGQLAGDIFLLTGNKTSFAAHQVELLSAIQQCGSISKAAKAVGISYKTAWDRIDAMNNMSPEPLVLRASGGAKGGGTQLTELGQRIIAGFQSLLEEHQQFIDQLGARLHSLQDIASFVSREGLSSSARNQFRGTIKTIKAGAIHSEVTLDIGAESLLTAIVTQDSLQQLGLTDGADCIAIINDSDIVLSGDHKLASSARNQLKGRVSRVITGAVNSDITLDLGNNKALNAVITNASASELDIQEGQSMQALFKAPSVILMRAR
ncbi:TOBE domain-containing protein [Marinomonas ostreistagni]|uniref:TOBE domain-containing protein n=1 Tax=Marinomonas ostreistagni TaxID=359209 RepID=UPI00194EAAA8|nr:TOBE domain-containing protein [Marinomonas ostreistagni]MBM6551877.1 TOBE domain-containing protein [Marinomonas ostreistagni]